MASARERYGEAFWRAHHEAWQQSALNQREYCEAHGIPLKAFGNWRAKFKAEPQPGRRRRSLLRSDPGIRVPMALRSKVDSIESSRRNGSRRPDLAGAGIDLRHDQKQRQRQEGRTDRMIDEDP